MEGGSKMTREELKQTLKDKLKECDKDTLVDIIADLCLAYIGAKVLVDMSSANCMQQPLNTIQTNIQEINNFIVQKINTNLYDTRKD
jgi:hypothetical protein